MEWQNMRYSQEFKDNVATRRLSKELSRHFAAAASFTSAMASSVLKSPDA